MKKFAMLIAIALMLTLLLAACSSTKVTDAPVVEATEQKVDVDGDALDIEGEDILEAFKKGGCAACHVIPGVPGATGTIGPDLSAIGEIAQARMDSGEYSGQADSIKDYIREALESPDLFIAPDCGGVACPKGLMSPTLIERMTDDEVKAIINFLSGLPGHQLDLSQTQTTPEAESSSLLTDEEFAHASEIFFDRCAGCHGVLRNGATGPALTPDLTSLKGTAGLASIIFNGTPRGMPDWGKQGILTAEETELMAEFIQMDPPQPLEMSLEKMMATWNVIVPVEDRPSEPQHDRDWQNFFAVTLRDAGQIALIDGDTYEIVNTINTGYAVHISRMSATGRYIYTIGRDGKLALIDTWMKVPDKIAEVQVCYDARSVETSKYSGPEGDFSDKYAIVGCYWPPHFVMLDGQTLEPFKIVSTRSYTYDTEEYHPEPRVAAITANHDKPEWIVNIKETGQIWLVNYVDPNNPTIKMIEAELFLHDGGWDSSKRYFLVAANQSNRVAVVDALDGNLEALVDTGAIPHPGRGANWIDPEFGPVWTTSHLGEGSLIAIGTDPEKHPESAWQVVRNIALPGGGSLFVKTHPESQWIWVDFGLNSDAELQRTICVIAKSNPTETYKCWQVADYGRAVHFEYNKQGTQVWVSVWGTADQPGKTGEIVVYDDITLEEITRIPNLITPTGKFNVFNTVWDIY
ncbi:MAG: nitrite reductase [Chloroflexi bacterium 44-23]|nr:MAG: nitrite reductase [Chloroflexi bacterium 44-23]